MIEREAIIEEFWRRMALVDGVRFTARNPMVPPSIDDLPAIQFFELSDSVITPNSRGASQRPVYRRELQLVAEAFIKAESEASSTMELALFVNEVKKALYVDGITLGRKHVELSEMEASRVIRPIVGGPVIGIGLTFKIRYVEDTQTLFS